MDICIRGINSNVVKALETSAKKHDLSREEYLRQCLEQVEESCCRLEDGLLEKESWSEESEGAIV